MTFAFRSQPLKTFYVLYFVVSTLVVRLPYWMLTSALPSMRPRRSWSFGRALLVRALKAGVMMQFDIGVSAGPDPEKQSRSASKLGFVWVEPVPSDFVVGDVAAAARTNDVRPARVPGYWFGERDASGGHGQRAAPGERVLYALHGGGYISGSSEPNGLLTPIVTGILSNSGGLIKRAFALDYRVASAAPFAAANAFPTALLDAVSGYRYLVHDLGFEPRNILVEGDSAGGHLSINLVLYLVRSQFKDLPPPGSLLMLSPTVDWARTHDKDASCSMQRNFRSDYVHTVLACGYTARALLGSLPQSELASNVYLSPSSLTLQYQQGFYGGFPPTCIIAGDAEVTLDPMRTIRDRLLADNGSAKITYHEYSDAIHDWLYLTMFEPQRSNALKDIEQWIIAVDRGREDSPSV